ncbi:ATP-binding protein [Clostridioides difficile]
MENFLNTLKEKFLIIDYSGNILFINTALLNQLKYNINEITNIDLLLSNNSFDIDYFINYTTKENILTFKTNKNQIITFKSTISLGSYNNNSSIFIILEDFKDDISKEDFKSLLDNSSFLAWIKNLDGKYVFTNTALANCFETHPNNCINKTSYDFFTFEYAEKITAEYSKVTNTKNSIIFNDTFKFKNGNEQFLQITLFPILNTQGHIKYYGGVARNLTIDKHFELDIVQSYTQLNTINNLLEESNRNSNEFKSLYKIGNNILNSLKCDEFHVWLYYNNEISIYYSSDYHNISKNLNSIKVCPEEFTKRLNNFNNWGLNSVDILSCTPLRDYYKNSLKYLCIQPITYENKFIGFLHIGYKDIVSSVLHRDEFITTLCRQFGMSMYNYTLSQNLRLELKKRINTEKELSFLLKTATDITSIISPDGSIKRINDGWCKLLGYTQNELLCKNWISITHEDDVNELQIFINDKLINSSSTHEICTRLLTNNGDIKWINWSCSYVKEENFIIATGRDITEEKKLEIEKKLIEDALHVESIKNEFFANISHEFKTPLNIILASLQVIAQNITNENIIISNDFNFSKYTNSIKQNSYRLLRLANNLIDITKIDTGYYEIHPKNCNIISIIEDITISVAQYIQDKGIELIFDTYTEELIVSCDPDKIERIMLNLLSNAIKYTKSPGKITVNIDTINNDVVISVKDSGIGISRENLPIIFERFMQVDNTLTRKCEGSGIGLSLVKSLVQMHGGKIAVYSIEGLGSEFTFTLPKITIPNSEIIYDVNDISHTRVEKCNIEFSDIYNI